MKKPEGASPSRVRASLDLAEPFALKIVKGSCSPIDGAREILRLAPWGETAEDLSEFHRLDELVDLWGVRPSDRRKYVRLIVGVAQEILKRCAR